MIAVSRSHPNFIDACSLISSHAATTSRKFSGRVVRPSLSSAARAAYSRSRVALVASLRAADSVSIAARCFAVTAFAIAARSAASRLSRAALRRFSSRRNRVRSARFSSAMTRTMSAPSNDELSSRHGVSIRNTSA